MKKNDWPKVKPGMKLRYRIKEDQGYLTITVISIPDPDAGYIICKSELSDLQLMGNLGLCEFISMKYRSSVYYDRVQQRNLHLDK